MKTLTLRNRFQGNTTLIENAFIDYYMIKANGEYVKVYLFLLRHLNNPCIPLTISKIADCLEYTEKDVLRALNYWEKEGLLVMDYDGSGTIAGVEFVANASVPEVQNAPLDGQASAKAPAVPAVEAPVEKPAPSNKIKPFRSQKEFKSLVFVIEQYLGKPLSKSDLELITYFYDTLQFSTDLIEYLIEYCVENGHKSMHYIKTVALAWADGGIRTVGEAKEQASFHSKDCYAVLKAFGITGRGPAARELDYIRKWSGEYGFELSLIVEACNRTIANTHQPSFEYADSILQSWIQKNVHTIADVEQLDLAYQNEKKKNSSSQPSKPAAKNKFNNFEGRSYDMDELEQQLLKTQ